MLELFTWLSYTALALFVVAIVWALKVATEMNNREIHHDSRPGSYYYESNKRRND